MPPDNERSLPKALVLAFCGVLLVAAAPATGVLAQESAGDGEPNDRMSNATQIAYGEEITANLSSPSDVDYYAVDAAAGDAVVPRLHLKNVFEGSAVAVNVISPDGDVSTELTNDLIDGPQNVAGEARPVGGTTDTAYTGDVMESDGTYYIQVGEASRFAETNDSDTYRYSLTVNRTALDAHEPNENGTTATPVEVGETTTASFAGYDSDVYAVNLTAGGNYTVDLKHDIDSTGHTSVWVYADEAQPVDDPKVSSPYVGNYGSVGEGASDDPYARSPYDFDPNGTTVAASDPQYGYSEPLTFTATTDGTYYVQIVQGPQNGDLLGEHVGGEPAPWPYDLTVAPTNESDPDDGTEPLPDGGDADDDGLANGTELDIGTDSRDADTDGDGIDDGTERVECGSDPLDPADP